MDKVLQNQVNKTEEPCLQRLVLERSELITIFNRLTEDERREEERAKARAEAEELSLRRGQLRIKDTLKVRHCGVVIQAPA